MKVFGENNEYIISIMNKNIELIPSTYKIEELLKKIAMNKECLYIVTDQGKKPMDRLNIRGVLNGEILETNIDKITSYNEPVLNIVSKTYFLIEEDTNLFDYREDILNNPNAIYIIKKNKKIIGYLDYGILLNKYILNDLILKDYLDISLEHIHEGMCIINKKGKVVFWNRAAEDLYNIRREDILNKSILDVLPNSLIYKSLCDDVEYRNIKHTPKKGAHVMLNSIPIKRNNKVIGAVSTDRDISEIENLSNCLAKERKKVERLKFQLEEIEDEKYDFYNINGSSKPIKDAIFMASKVAKTDASVLIRGESGTGKEIFARSIHKNSGRKGSFVPINCSAIPSNLFESELFGYEKGAFTGAQDKGKPGKFELAHEGTLFLDEIGDMPLMMQAKLLRVLQDGVVTRLGGDKQIKTNSRILAATNQDLEKMMKEGNFREDLYYRINVVTITIPPLRDRKEDIPNLIVEFIEEFNKKNNKAIENVSPAALEVLTEYDWEGNIRELRNIIERLVILSKGKTIDLEDLPKNIFSDNNNNMVLDLNGLESIDFNEAIESFEKKLILKALTLDGWNKSRAAKRLNMKRSTLYYKMDLYNIKTSVRD